MSEELETPDATDEDAAIAAEVAQEIGVSEVKTDKVTSALIGSKKALRDALRRVKELEPIAARVSEVDGKLESASPIINAILSSPKLKAEALRIANGTRPSQETTDQPDDDPDAAGYAEDMGWYATDGQTLDTARARRVLNRLDTRHGRQTDERIRPLAGVTLQGKADENIRAAMNETDADGVPLASRESIEETKNMLLQNGGNMQLLANPGVVDLVLNYAMGIDRRKGRAPKAQEEPLYFETGGSRGRRTEASLVDADLKAAGARLGLTEKDLADSSKRLVDGVTNRRGIALGGK